MANDLTRRNLLEQAGKWAAAGAVLNSGLTGRAEEAKTQPASTLPASERIRVGFIGVGGRAQGYMREFIAEPEVEVVALADVYDKRAEEARAIVAEKGHKPQIYRDFRELLDHKDIDAVAVGTPDHWHAIPTILACQAGMDVYVEKPLGHTIAEGRAMVNAAKKNKRVTQLGTQVHATENYRRVVEVVQSGILGDIHKTRVWIAKNAAPNGIGKPEDCPPPADCDYDMWLGPAPKRPFNPLRWSFNWRYFWDYAGGTMQDMSCHTIDLIYWALNLKWPKTVVASGGRYALNDIGETPDTMEAVWDYAAEGNRKPMQLVWTLMEGNGHGIDGKGMGIAFYGTKATLRADYGNFEILDKLPDGVELPKPSIPPSPGHVREFLNSVKTRARCSCDIEYGHRLSCVPQMANIAYKVGQKLTWDADKEQFDSPEANKLLTKEYRDPWSLPDAV